MNDFVSTQRRDLIPPCAKGCPERTAVCRDSCRREEFIQWKDLMKKQKADNEFRRNAKSIDNHRAVRNRRAATYLDKKGR